MRLKEMGFSLSEIKEILNYLRLEVEVIPNLNQFLLDFYKNKLEMIDEERKLLDLKEIDLKEKITSIEESLETLTAEEPEASGIDLQFLPLLSCNKCGKGLNLKQAEIIDGEIMNGILGCSCGMEYNIQDGILLFEGFDADKKTPILNTKEDVVKRYPSEYTSIRTIAEQWLKDKIQEDLKEKDIILDLTITGGIYLLSLFETMKERNILYIGCERWLNFLKLSKKSVEALPNKPKILFCCGDIRYAPFKPSLFDKLIDVYGTMTDMRETGDFKIPHKISLLKDSGQLYGTYYNISKLSSENAENLRKSLNFDLIEKELQKLTKINFMPSPKTKEFGEFNTILKTEGREELTLYSYIGKKETSKEHRNTTQ